MIRDTGIPTDDRIYQRDFYEHCSSKIVSVFAPMKEVVSIYRFGQVQSPGNSDIDLIFIVKKRKDIGHIITDAFKTNFTKTEQYIVFQHDPMLLTESLMRYVHYIRIASDLRHLYGKQILIEKRLGDPIKVMQLVELIIGYYPRLSCDKAPEFYRWPLQIINTYKFIQRNAESIGFTFISDEIQNILNQNDNLRRNIRDIGQHEIRKFCAHVFPVLKSHLTKIEDWLASEIVNRYRPWPDSSRNIKIQNIVLKSRENRYLNNLAHRRELYFHSGVFSPLFFETRRLPKSVRKHAIKRLDILKSYAKFLYNECCDVGLYRPWYLRSFTLKGRIVNYISQLLVNSPYSYILGDLYLRIKPNTKNS